MASSANSTDKRLSDHTHILAIKPYSLDFNVSYKKKRCRRRVFRNSLTLLEPVPVPVFVYILSGFHYQPVRGDVLLVETLNKEAYNA